MSNENGTVANLLPGTARPPMPNYRHGLTAKSHPPLSPEQLEEVSEIMTLPHIAAADAPVVVEFVRIGHVLEMLDARLSRGQLKFLDARNRLSGRFLSYATALGLTPAERASWVGRLSMSESRRQLLQALGFEEPDGAG